MSRYAATGKPLGEPLRHEGDVMSAQFSPNGSRIVTASWDYTARVWDAPLAKALGEPLGEPLRHEASVSNAQFSPDGSHIVTASEDKTARVWDAATGKLLGKPLRHEASVMSAQFSPDGSRIVTASADQTAHVWDAATGKPLGEPLRHEGDLMNAQFSPDGSRIVTASWDYTARVWDAATGKPLGEPLRHEGSVRVSRSGRPIEGGVRSAQFSPDGTRIVTASTNKTARIWDAATGKPLGEPLRHEASVRNAQFSPDGSRIVTASEDKTARVWNSATGKALGEPLRHKDSVGSAQFSPDGSHIVTASDDNTARVWNGATGEPIGEPLRHEAGVISAQFSPDGSRIVTASALTARVWGAATGMPLGEPLRHEGSVGSARFSPDGSRIVTVSNQAARVWNAAKITRPPLPVPDWMRERASAAAGFRFTADGDLQPISFEERIIILRKPAPENEEWAVLGRWLALPAAERTVTPDSRFTCRQLAERERDTLLRDGLESALRYDPTVPLARLLLAGALLREEAEKEPDLHDPSLPRRAAFLREYDLQRMPDDAVLLERAARALHEQKDEVRMRRALEKLGKLVPERAEAVRKELDP